MATKLKHRFDTEEKYQTALKLAIASYPNLFCKYINGGAYYIVSKKEWLNSPNSLDLTHITTRQVFTVSRFKIEIVDWINISENYAMDVLSIDAEVRLYFGDLYIHTSQNKQEMDLSNRVTGAVKELLERNKGRLLQIASNGETYSVFPQQYVAVPATANTFQNHPINLCKELKVEDFFEDLNTNNTNKKTDSKMSFLNNIPGLNLDFGKFNSDKIALGFDMKPVFKTAQGGYAKVTEGKILEYQGDLKFDFDFFKVPVQSNQLAIGDIVLDNGALLIVDETTKGDLKFINPLTGNKSSTLVKTNLLGMFFYTKIVSLFALGGDGQADGVGIGGLNPMMLMLLSQKGEGVNSSKDLLPLLLMSGNLSGAAGSTGGINPMMLMMMSGDKGSGSGLSDMLPLLLMSQQSGQGTNPFGNLFGSAPAKTVKAARRTPVKVAVKGAIKKAVAPIAKK